MTPTLPPPRDWFDDFWDNRSPTFPVYLRGNAVKELARRMMQEFLKGMAQQAGTPEGVRALIAFGRIQLMVRALCGPDPTPDQVADVVQRLVDRIGVKP